MYIIGINPKIVYPAIAVPPSTANIESPTPFALGSRGLDQAGNEYVFLQVAATFTPTDGSVGLIDSIAASTPGLGVWQFHTFSSANDAGLQRLAVCRNTMTAGQFGWFQRYGQGLVLAAVGTVSQVKLYASAAAGVLDDVSATFFGINGINLLATGVAPPTGTPAFIQYPITDAVVGV